MSKIAYSSHGVPQDVQLLFLHRMFISPGSSSLVIYHSKYEMSGGYR